ncbi:MAG TPA: hypothetical protein VFM90_02315, partial [Cyclobacteriaceae bacterium]|nr:hypothetical protein [Cyclobacteriaceae bacterium]
NVTTGFELRPTSNERFVWDFLEYRARIKVPDESLFVGANSINGATSEVLFISSVGPAAVLKSDRLLVGGTAYKGNAGNLASNKVTLIFAGTVNVSAVGTYSVALCVGAAAPSHWLAASINKTGAPTWEVNFYASGFPLATPRVVGDVLIITLDGANVTAWLNGFKFTTSKTLTLNNPTALTFLNGAAFGDYFNGDVYFASVFEDVFDDTMASSWTAWLQGRYSIPEL